MAYWDGTRWLDDPAETTMRTGRRHRLLGAATEGALIASIIFGLMAGTTLAARPTRATLAVEPNAAPAWGAATASGCGYGASEVYLDIEKPEALAFMGAMPDEDGCISITFTTDGPGMYHLAARQQGKRHWTTMASYDLPVE